MKEAARSSVKKRKLCPWCGRRISTAVVVCRKHGQTEVALRRHHRGELS